MLAQEGLDSLAQAFAGSLASLAKTISHEWSNVHTRAIDIARDFGSVPDTAKAALEASLLEGPIELGLTRAAYYRLALVEEPFTDPEPQEILKPGDTVLVTGGARGVTASTLLSLAKSQVARFVIWGRTPLAPEEAVSTRSLEGAPLKLELLRLNPALKHPRDLEKAYRALLSQREIEATFRSLRDLGSEVVYEAVDVSRDEHLSAAFASLRSRYPIIRGVIHGAGVIRDKFIVDQSPAELQEVLDTKLRILPYFEELAKAATSWVVFFSSSTARMGRKGQGAYGLANEILNLTSAYFSSKLSCRTIAMNWGPWDGGMVHDGLKKLFASEGLGTIPMAAGSDLQTYILERPQLGSGQWLVLGEGGQKIVRPHLSGSFGNISVSVRTTPMLLDHVINGRAVVPVALLLEWLAENARLRFPTRKFAGVKSFRLWKGIVLSSESEVRVAVEVRETSAGSYEGRVWSRNAKGSTDFHASAVLELYTEFPTGEVEAFVPHEKTLTETIRPYDILFHGPSLHYIERVLESTPERWVAEIRLHGDPTDWNIRRSFEAQGPLLDAIFQGAIVWVAVERGARGLPSRFTRLEYFEPWSTQEAILEIRIRAADSYSLQADAYIWKRNGELIARMTGFEATVSDTLIQAFANRILLERTGP